MTGAAADLLSTLGVAVAATGSGTEVAATPVGPTGAQVVLRAADGRPTVRFEVDLGTAVGYWSPAGRSSHLLPADWSEPSVTSLVSSAPLGAVYDGLGRVLLGWAAAEPVAELSITAGVSEEHKSFVVAIEPVRPLAGDLVVRLDVSGDPLPDTVRRLTGWLSDLGDGIPLTAPPVARVPVYSTWYTFTQDIDADLVRSEAELAAELGCGSVFIDDGWQHLGHGRGYQGCGDWVADQEKFVDLAGTVAGLHDLGLGVALWVAPLLLGTESDVFAELAPFAERWVPALQCHVLDPRHARVRDFVVDTCVRLVQDLGVDLLKIDFLDQAMVYRDDASTGDLDDVGQAMQVTLGRLRERLAEIGRSDVAFEFRQPYVSPAIARFGEILRASDCPGDSAINRQSTIDARLVSVGQTVHADPMMWGPGGGAEAVAQQLYAGWFSVPQISMRLATLPEAQTAALQGLLGLWRDHADLVLDADLELAGAEQGYTMITAVAPDRSRAVVARYAPVVLDLDRTAAAETTVLNATTETRLVLRTTQPVTGGVVRSASADVVDQVPPSLAGLVELGVPAYGSVTLHLERPS